MHGLVDGSIFLQRFPDQALEMFLSEPFTYAQRLSEMDAYFPDR